MKDINIGLHAPLTKRVFEYAKSFLLHKGRKRIEKNINREFLGKVIIELANFYDKFKTNNLKFFTIIPASSRRDLPQLYRQNEHLFDALYEKFIIIFNSEFSKEDFKKEIMDLVKNLAFSRIDVLRKARNALKTLRVKKHLNKAQGTQLSLPIKAEVQPWKY